MFDYTERFQESKSVINLSPEMNPIKNTADNSAVPLYCKVYLKPCEAARYSGIGINRIKKLLRGPECTFRVTIGKQRRIKRVLFEEWLLKCDRI